jgi:hypothetical protein
MRRFGSTFMAPVLVTRPPAGMFFAVRHHGRMVFLPFQARFRAAMKRQW